MSDPAKKSSNDFDSSAWIIYETKEEAAEALPELQNLFVQIPDAPAPIRLMVSDKPQCLMQVRLIHVMLVIGTGV